MFFSPLTLTLSHKGRGEISFDITYQQEARKTCLNTFPKITYGH